MTASTATSIRPHDRTLSSRLPFRSRSLHVRIQHSLHIAKCSALTLHLPNFEMRPIRAATRRRSRRRERAPSSPLLQFLFIMCDAILSPRHRKILRLRRLRGLILLIPNPGNPCLLVRYLTRYILQCTHYTVGSF